MSKVYLLLRSNRQTGPFDLQELLQQNLKPFDLVWIEGRSFGWKYPSEIETLKPFLNFTIENDTSSLENLKTEPIKELTNHTNKAVFISMPSGALNKPVKPINPIKTYSPSEDSQSEQPEHLYPHFKKEPLLETKYNMPLSEIEENYSSWVYDQKTNKRAAHNLRPLVYTALIIIVIAAGAWITSTLFNNPDQEAINQSPIENQFITPSVKNVDSNKGITEVSVTQDAIKIIPTISGANKSMYRVPANNKSYASNPDYEGIVLSEEITSNDPLPIMETEVVIADKNTASKPKKKKIGEAIESFFDRLEGKNEQGQSEQVYKNESQNTNNESERRASRREEFSSIETENITDLIQIDSNAPPENWMTGIQGIKITLKNNSNKTLKTAMVEVDYFDEYNNLIAIKKMEFKNISAGSSKTLPVPEHRTADHINYKLISTEAKENKFLKAF